MQYFINPSPHKYEQPSIVVTMLSVLINNTDAEITINDQHVLSRTKKIIKKICKTWGLKEPSYKTINDISGFVKFGLEEGSTILYLTNRSFLNPSCDFWAFPEACDTGEGLPSIFSNVGGIYAATPLFQFNDVKFISNAYKSNAIQHYEAKKLLNNNPFDGNVILFDFDKLYRSEACINRLIQKGTRLELTSDNFNLALSGEPDEELPQKFNGRIDPYLSLLGSSTSALQQGELLKDALIKTFDDCNVPWKKVPSKYASQTLCSDYNELFELLNPFFVEGISYELFIPYNDDYIKDIDVQFVCNLYRNSIFESSFSTLRSVFNEKYMKGNEDINYKDPNKSSIYKFRTSRDIT